MATISAFTSLNSIPKLTYQSNSLSFTLKSHKLHFSNSFNNFSLKKNTQNGIKNSSFNYVRRLKSVEGDDTQIPEAELEQEETAVEQQQQAAVSVPVSPSDTLTMFFLAEGTMSEATIPTVTKALEGSEGVSDLKVQVVEGIASVELTKQTTVQATGVASGLVELIQGSGFKLQTLNLSFADEEDALV